MCGWKMANGVFHSKMNIFVIVYSCLSKPVRLLLCWTVNTDLLFDSFYVLNFSVTQSFHLDSENLVYITQVIWTSFIIITFKYMENNNHTPTDVLCVCVLHR